MVKLLLIEQRYDQCELVNQVQPDRLAREATKRTRNELYVKEAVKQTQQGIERLANPLILRRRRLHIPPKGMRAHSVGQKVAIARTLHLAETKAVLAHKEGGHGVPLHIPNAMGGLNTQHRKATDHQEENADRARLEEVARHMVGIRIVPQPGMEGLQEVLTARDSTALLTEIMGVQALHSVTTSGEPQL